jgi:hypothetical protein
LISRPAQTLYAALLWWIAVLTVQAMAELVGSGMYFQLLYNGATPTTLFGMEAGLAGLALLLLWVGFALALRPGGLEPPAWLHHWAVPIAAVLLLLGSMGLNLLMPTVRTALLADALGAEGLAFVAQRQQAVAIASHALHGLTYAVLLGLLWVRSKREHS